MILVAGAGPVGLVAACVIAGAGQPVTLLEKRGSLNTASRASTFHPPTMDILDRLGAVRPLIEEGVLVDRSQYRTPEGIFAEFPLSLLASETRFPFRRHLEQARVTPGLLAQVRASPLATVRFHAEVASVAQDDESVRVVLACGEVLAGTALVAADGARSAVRQALGIDFPGFTYPNRVLRLMTDEDLTIRLPDLAPISYLHHGGRSASFLKMPDCWRIILRVPEETTDADALDEGWILARLRDALPGWDSVPRTLHKDVYAASRHCAGRFDAGRVFLIGDAAHLTNTRGGMNMNAGIHDAWEVAGALAAGGIGAATDAARARHRIARDLLLPRTDRNVTGGADWLDRIRAMAGDPEAARAHLRSTAMLDMVTL